MLDQIPDLSSRGWLLALSSRKSGTLERVDQIPAVYLRALLQDVMDEGHCTGLSSAVLCRL